jgi:DNA/RNA endonuclease YhcR with UshA esterase domain
LIKAEFGGKGERQRTRANAGRGDTEMGDEETLTEPSREVMYLGVIPMKRSIKSLTYFISSIFAFLIWVSGSIAQQEYISPIDAPKYIGMEKTVCGTVASATYAFRSKGQPTFLNLDQPHPNQIFTVVIWGSNRNKFKSPPETSFRGKRICVTGIIESYRGKPEIVVRDPDQIVVKPQ